MDEHSLELDRGVEGGGDAPWGGEGVVEDGEIFVEDGGCKVCGDAVEADGAEVYAPAEMRPCPKCSIGVLFTREELKRPEQEKKWFCLACRATGSDYDVMMWNDKNLLIKCPEHGRELVIAWGSDYEYDCPVAGCSFKISQTQIENQAAMDLQRPLRKTDSE